MGQRVQIGRECRGQGFAFTGFLLGHIALMQENRTHQLCVERPQAQCTPCAFAAVRKGFRQEIIQAFTLQRAGCQLLGLVLDVFVRHLLELRLKRIDLLDQRSGRPDLAIIARTKNLFGDFSESQHAISSRSLNVSRDLLAPQTPSP